jgi:hypothetical protein
MKTIIVLLLCTSIGIAQTVYDIPFASKGNVIELSVANISSFTAAGVKVEVTNAPTWLKFETKADTLQQLKSKEEQIASFTFSVEKTAELKKEHTLNFKVTDKNGQTWAKEITVRVAPPTTYELYQNYPNPFNPTTTIEYQLPGTGTRYNVTLKIYDVIGREVVQLVNEQQEPGYYQKTFNASRYASGMYIYRLVASDDQNNNPAQKTAGKHVFQKKMMLLK